MKKSRCLLSYRRYYRVQLGGLTNAVLHGIYSNASVFETPIVSETAFRTIQAAFDTTGAKYETYGITKRVDYLNAKQALIAALDTLANYVNGVANGNISIIALSGFEHTRVTSEGAKPLPAIKNFNIKRTEVTGEFIVIIPSMLAYGKVSYCCICSENEPIPSKNLINGQMKLPSDGPAVFFDFNKSRRKVFSGLKPGTMYYFHVFAINAVSVSPITQIKYMMAA